MQSKRIAFYCRVSTKGQTTANQVHQLRNWWDRAQDTPGWEQAEHAPAHLYEDVSSGAKDSRPGLKALNEALFQREVNVVVVTALDRLARSVAHMSKLTKEWDALGVVLVSLREGFDTSTPTGRAFVQMATVFAELERSLIAERVQAARARAKAEGRHIGRKPIDPQRRRELKDMLRAGVPQREIALRLDIGKGTVSDYARRFKEAV